MNESYEPYNDAERMDMLKGIEELGAVMGMGAVVGRFGTGLVLRTLRYEATVAQVEADLAVERLTNETGRESFESLQEEKAQLRVERFKLKKKLRQVEAERDAYKAVVDVA